MQDVVEFTEDNKITIGFLLVPSDIDFVNYATRVFQSFDNIRLRFQHLDLTSSKIDHSIFENGGNVIFKTLSNLQPRTSNSYGSIDIILLACTSMSFVLGRDQINTQIRKGYPAVRHSSDMATSILKAVKIFNPQKIAVLTPYKADIHENCLNFLRSNGLEISQSKTFNIEDDAKAASISLVSIENAMQNLESPVVDVYVIVCSSLRTMEPGFIDKLEDRLQRTVITSSQAMIWQTMRLAGIKDTIENYGKLFDF